MSLRTRSFFINPVFFYLILLFCFIPESFSHIGIPGAVVQIVLLIRKFIGVPIIVLCLLVSMKTLKKDLGDVLLFYAWKIIGTIAVTFVLTKSITGGGAFEQLRRMATIWFIGIAMHYRYQDTVRRLTYVLTFLVVVNLITMLAFPHGMYVDDNWQNYFLGYDNGHIVVFMPALLLAERDAFFRKKNTLLIINFVCIYISVFICRSGATLSAMAVLLVLLIAIRFQLFRRLFVNGKFVLAAVAAVFIFIVILRGQEVFAPLVTKYLGKDLTFTGRTFLWDKAFEIIRKYFWFGEGDSSAVNTSTFTLHTQQLAYAHNEILDILVRSGVIGLVLYMVCIVRSVACVKGHKDMQAKIWLAFMGSYWLAMMFESYSNYSFYYLYFVMLLMPRFERRLEKKYRAEKNAKLWTKRSLKTMPTT